MKKLFLILFLFVSVHSFGQFVNNNRQIVNVLNFKVKGDMKSGTDGSYTGTTQFQSASASFSAVTDIGKTIRIQMASSDLITTIVGVTNSTTITLANSTTGTRSSQTYDYGTDNTAGFQAAANAISAIGGDYYIPPGDYLKNGLLNFVNPTRIIGTLRSGIGTDDSTSSTIRPKTIIHEISTNLPQSVNIQAIGSSWEGVDMYNSATQSFVTSGIGLNINASDVSLTDAQFGSFWIAVDQNYSGYWKADHCAFAGIQYGLLIRNLQSQDNGDWTINDCWFGGYAAHPASSCILMQSSGGAKISNCKWNFGFHKGISLEPLANTTSDLQIQNCSFENFDSTGINVLMNGSGFFGNITIVGNQFSPFTSHTTGVKIIGASHLNTVGINDNVFFGTSGDTAVVVSGISGVTISNNRIDGVWTKSVYIDPTCTRVTTDIYGKLFLPSYGSGTNTGTPAFGLSVDASGNVIETTSGSAALTSTQVGYGNGSNVLTGDASLTYTTSTGTFTLSKAQAASSSVNVNNPTSGTGASASISVGSTKTTEILQYSPLTTAYGGFIGNAGGLYTTSTNLVLMADVASSELDVAVGGTSPTTKYKLTGTSINPSVTLTNDLGTSSLGWRHLFVAEGAGGFAGQVALVSGTKAITISGVTTSSRAFVTLVSQGGTVTTTVSYAAVCTSNTLTITALTSSGTTDTTDTSTINYFVINGFDNIFEALLTIGILLGFLGNRLKFYMRRLLNI